MTPCVARKQRLAAIGGREKRGDRFYNARVGDQHALRRIRTLDEAAALGLRANRSRRDDPLTAQRLIDATPGGQQASIWFCDPSSFGEVLREGLTSRRRALEDFQQEDFACRWTSQSCSVHCKQISPR